MAKIKHKSNTSTKERKVNEEIKTGTVNTEATTTDTPTPAVTTEAPATTTDQGTDGASGQGDIAPLVGAGTTTDETANAPTVDTAQAGAPAAAGEGEGTSADELATPPAAIVLDESNATTGIVAATPVPTAEQIVAAVATVSTTTEAPAATAATPAAITGEAPTLLQHLQTINPNITEVPANIKNFGVMLDGYIKAMAPGTPVNAREGVNHQKLLKHILEQAIAAPNYQLAIEAVLFYFHQHSGRTFSDRYLGRFVHEMQLTAQQTNTFNTLRVVFQTLAEPTGRATRIKLALDISKIAKTIDQKLVRNLLAFMDNAK